MKSMRFFVAVVCVGAIALSATITHAQEGPPPKPCTSEEYSQFDFWVGDWRVTNAKGEFQGTNLVEKIHNGCAIQENWEGAQGTRGSSFNIYAKRRGQWHQTWVDTNGMLLMLDGGFEDGRMVMRGQMPTADGKGKVEHEISWTPKPDGTLVQQWRISQDGGENWRDLFVGTYSRKK